MKSLFISTLLLVGLSGFSQEHFTGLTSSNRLGIISASNNPAELVNMSKTFEISFFGISATAANDKIGFSDLFSDNFEEQIFEGNKSVNLAIDAEIFGPSFAMKYKGWGFGLTTKIKGKLDVVDVDPTLGDGLINSGINSLFGANTISNNNNQRFNGTTWGEIGLTAARTIYNDETHKVSVGATFKLLFPGSYANLGLDKFNGTITNNLGNVELTNTTANLNITYSGSLADSFSNFSDYTKSAVGSLNGFSGDIGVNYQWKDDNDTKANNNYKVNFGASVRNIGSMTFKDKDNQSTNYNLNIQGAQSLNLNQFQNVDSLEEIEDILLSSGYLTATDGTKDFKVNLPTTLSLYADVKLIQALYVSGYLQQRMKENSGNDQISAQNMITLTPRFYTGIFEVYAPFSNSEISGFNTGIGFRVGGFYLGSGSIVTALINDSKQADVYLGFRYGFL